MGARDISLLRNQGLLHEFNPLALIKFLSNVSIQRSISSGTVHVVGKWTPPLSTLSVSLSLRDRHLGLNRPLTSFRFGTHYRGIFNRGLDGARTPLACHTRPTRNTVHYLLDTPPLPYLSRHLRGEQIESTVPISYSRPSSRSSFDFP